MFHSSVHVRALVTHGRINTGSLIIKYTEEKTAEKQRRAASGCQCEAVKQSVSVTSPLEIDPVRCSVHRRAQLPSTTALLLDNLQHCIMSNLRKCNTSTCVSHVLLHDCSLSARRGSPGGLRARRERSRLRFLSRKLTATSEDVSWFKTLHKQGSVQSRGLPAFLPPF